jgi:hypothetical protein
MVIRVAELARAGLLTDWMSGVVPRCVPVDTRQNLHGIQAVTEVVGTQRALTQGKWRTVEVLVGPMTWRAASKTDQRRPARLWGSVVGAGLGAGWVVGGRHAARGGADGGDATGMAVKTIAR